MKFDKPAGENPIDQLKVVGRPHDRIDGPLKTTGTARYAYEWHEEAPNAAYGYIVGSAIAKGRLTALDTDAAQKAPGVLAVITASNAGALGKGDKNTARLLGGPTIEHYHQAIALVVAETFEQARAAASLVQAHYRRNKGAYSLADEKQAVSQPPEDTPDDLEKVKQKFFKAKNSVRGSGIGLAVVDEIVGTLGGKFDIASTLGQGTTVTVTLPVYHPGQEHLHDKI